MKNYPYTIDPFEKRGYELFSVKFYRAVQKPYIQTIILTWIEEDDIGNIPKKRQMLGLKERAEE